MAKQTTEQVVEDHSLFLVLNGCHPRMNVTVCCSYYVLQCRSGSVAAQAAAALVDPAALAALWESTSVLSYMVFASLHYSSIQKNEDLDAYHCGVKMRGRPRTPKWQTARST
eukprot:6198685-Pleurochrysis_carterae.AAC.1